MKALFINILELSVTTGVIILIFYLVCKLFGERIKSSTKYIVWVIVLLRLLLPFESSYSIIKYYNPVVQSASSSHENLSVDIDVFGLLCTVWLCVMAALFSVRMVAYISLAVKVRGSIKYCTKASQRVSVYVTNVVKTPCLFGLIFPKILLPYEIENKEDLELIIAHELYHHKRLDLWVKFIDNLIKCIYWFNPIEYH